MGDMLPTEQGDPEACVVLGSHRCWGCYFGRLHRLALYSRAKKGTNPARCCDSSLRCCVRNMFALASDAECRAGNCKLKQRMGSELGLFILVITFFLFLFCRFHVVFLCLPQPLRVSAVAFWCPQLAGATIVRALGSPLLSPALAKEREPAA